MNWIRMQHPQQGGASTLFISLTRSSSYELQSHLDPVKAPHPLAHIAQVDRRDRQNKQQILFILLFKVIMC